MRRRLIARPRWKTWVASIAALLLLAFSAVVAFPAQTWNAVPFLPDLSIPDFRLGLDLQGGAHLIYEADMSQIAEADRGEALDGVKDVIERRVNAFGVSEPLVQTTVADGHYRVVIELAGVLDVSQAIKQIGETPILEFKEPNPAYYAELEATPTFEVSDDGQPVEIPVPTAEPWINTTLSGKQLESARVEFDPNTGTPLVALNFDSEGAELFAQLTERNVGAPIAIFLDGELISAPRVQEKISGGQAVITGDFTLPEAKLLAQRLNAGALPVPVELVSQQTVGPTLGQASLNKSIIAALIGFALVALFMILYYRLPGFLAVAALLTYAFLNLVLYKGLDVTMTLAGVAGFILSVGMAVDANVLIFERFKEEVASGRDLPTAIEEAFIRAWPSIRDGNLTTLIAAAILFWFSSSFIKGFALTLSIGVLTSMFSAIVITRSYLRLVSGWRWLNKSFLFGVRKKL